MSGHSRLFHLEEIMSDVCSGCKDILLPSPPSPFWRSSCTSPLIYKLPCGPLGKKIKYCINVNMLSKTSYLIGFLLFHFLNKNVVVMLDKKLNLKMIISYRKVKSPIYLYFSSPVHRYVLITNL